MTGVRVDEPIVMRFEVERDSLRTLLTDQAFLTRARLLLHEQAGGCYSNDPTVCYDNHHRPMIDTYRFLVRLFGDEPLPEEPRP